MRGRPAKTKRSPLLRPKGQGKTFVYVTQPQVKVPEPGTSQAVWLDERTAKHLDVLQAKLGLASAGDAIAWLCIQIRALHG